MARYIVDGVHDFSAFRAENCFYVDKTAFIHEWWSGRSKNAVSLITRPRRFGKSLMLSTVEHFFSIKYAGRSDLFEGLEVWKDKDLRLLQGTYPVIFFSLVGVKGNSFAMQREQTIREIVNLFAKFRYIREDNALYSDDLDLLDAINCGMSDGLATSSLKLLCELLYRVHGKKVIVLIDEYDTPLQEAWLNGLEFWNESVAFLRNLFIETLKNNEYLERAILTGVTRICRESIFSDLNNLRVFSISTPRYMTSFGFTEKEVFAAMDEFGLTDREGVKAMYDGYTFGTVSGIYNPWSVISYLQDPRLELWWANTSSNGLVGKLIREGSAELMQELQTLLDGGSIRSEIDEQIVFNCLTGNEKAVWSLLLASGYLKPVRINGREYELKIVNGEVRQIFEAQVMGWFADSSAYNNFIKALLQGDLKYMNKFMNAVALSCFSSFDTGTHPSQSQPERFYHGFVLGLLVDLRDRYILASNRESGYGRYDVMLEPRRPGEDPAFVIEFKVHDPDDEADLQATVTAALAQIEAKGYAQQLLDHGIPADRIRKYGFAFKGKQVLIG